MKSEIVIAPHSIEAESSVLGSILLDPESMQRVPAMVPEAFYRKFHQDAFRAMQKLAAGGKPIDCITTWEAMTEDERDGFDLPVLTGLQTFVHSAANIRRYAEIVLEKWRARQLLQAGWDIAALAAKEGDPAEHVNEAQMLLAKLATVKGRREPRLVRDTMPEYLRLLDDMKAGKNPAMPTWIGGLDRLLNGGLRRGEVLVIGARPKHGKTALALALARNLARRFWTCFLSQEMPVMQLMHRHTAALGTIDLGSILRADPDDVALWAGVREASAKLEALKLLHDDQCALHLLDVRRKAMKVKRENGLDVLMVDFLQLMEGAGEDNRNRELDVIVNGLKQLAMDLDCACVILSQMSRKADEHYGRPTMTHLRDSGAIEAAADQIALLFTDHAHPLSQKLDLFAGFSELEIVAHRNGPTGLVPLAFRGEYQQIGDWQGPVPQMPKKQQAQRGMD